MLSKPVTPGFAEQQIYEIFRRGLTFTAMYYSAKLESLASLLKTARTRRAWLASGRVAAILVAAYFGYLAWGRDNALWVLAVVGSLAAFARVLVMDLRNSTRIRRLEAIRALITQEQAFLGGTPIPGNEGSEFAIPDHPYAYDLDVFGKGSLFGYVNRAQSEPGRLLVATWLMRPATCEAILERQDAVKEIAKDPDWLFDLLAIGKETPLRIGTAGRIKEWFTRPTNAFSARYWGVIRWVYPVITLTTLGLCIGGVISVTLLGLCCLVFLAVSSAISKQITEHYELLSGIVGEISLLSESLSKIEGKTFHVPLNVRLRTALTEPTTASGEINRLDRLLHLFDYRLSPLIFLPLNAFVLWDLQQMNRLRKWQERNRQGIDHWLSTLAEVEGLSSLALLHFNNPSWAFPEITTAHFRFDATALGHPLIPESRRVSNDFRADGSACLDLVTGSNMAGKSTFLRTVGVNMVLGMAGAPTCAVACSLSPVLVVSSMRVADNLEDSTSTFYAELKKLKDIIERVKRGEQVFLLLDEILRGTNSRDRLTGSKALVQQLIRDGAVGIIATHDLELAQLSDSLDRHIRNYYFDVHMEGAALDFDYKLRPGVCQTKNAELLMRQIGIELA